MAASLIPKFQKHAALAVSLIKREQTYIWDFSCGVERFICIAKNENEVIKLYNNTDRLEEFYIEQLNDLKTTVFNSRPLIFGEEKYLNKRSDNLLKLVKKIKIYNSKSQIIYGFTC